MHRFFNLVKNEYIKNFKRSSTVVMLVLVLLAGIGLPALAKIVQSLQDQWDYSYSYSLEDEINDLTAMKENSMDAESEFRLALLSELQELGVEGREDWRYCAASKLLNESCADLQGSFPEQYEEYYEYVSAFEDGAEEYYSEDAEKLRYEADKNALTQLDGSGDYQKAKGIILSGKLSSWYDYLEEKDKAALSSASGSLKSSMEELISWYYGYLRAENIPYYGNTASAEEVLGSPSYYPEYDLRYFNASQMYSSKLIIIQYDAGMPVDAAEYNKAVNAVALADYKNGHGITYNIADEHENVDFWQSIEVSVYGVSLIGLLLIVLAALSVSSEFANGTIKFLLINPVKRWKILASKYFTTITTGYLMLAILFIVSLLSSLLFFGGSLLGESYIRAVNGEVFVTSGIVYMLKSYLLSSVKIVVMATFAFSISTLMKSSSFAIAISMLGMVGGNTIVTFLAAFKQDWARYLIFSNLDLDKIASGGGIFMYQTVGFAVTVIAVHMAVFLLIAWDGFTRREI